MPQHLARAVMPIVRHTYHEYLAGLPVTHVLWQAAVAGAFLGMGHPPLAALRATERLEQALGIREPAAYHAAELAALARGRRHPAWRRVAPG